MTPADILLFLVLVQTLLMLAAVGLLASISSRGSARVREAAMLQKDAEEGFVPGLRRPDGSRVRKE